MRRFTRNRLMLAALVACLMSGDELWAKNGRGGSKGGGGKGFKGSADFRGHGGNKSSAGPTNRGKRKPSFHEEHGATNGKLNHGDQPWTKHQAREQRKLDHRKQVADHLRDISERNGNEHLQQVADDMDERAQAHYDKQMEKIRQKYGLEDPASDADPPESVAEDTLGGADDTHDDSGEFHNGEDNSLDQAARKLTGRENALFRQLRNEERKLAMRMEEVKRMRAMAEQTGDESTVQAADRLEQWAMDHYDERISQIGEFRERHGLPDVVQHSAR